MGSIALSTQDFELFTFRAMTEGIIDLSNERGLRLSLMANPSLCAALPMLIHKKSVTSHLTRIAFSLCELDDTSRPGGRLMLFELTLLSRQAKKQSFYSQRESEKQMRIGVRVLDMSGFTMVYCYHSSMRS
jgi:hypothetical protein